MASRVGSVQVIMEPRYFMFSLVGMGVLSMKDGRVVGVADSRTPSW